MDTGALSLSLSLFLSVSMTLSEWCVQGPSCYFSGNNPKCLVFIKTVSWLDLYTRWRVCGFGSTGVFFPVRSCGCESMFCIHVCVGPVWHLTPFQIMQENISSQKTYKYLSAVMLFCHICAVTMVDAHSVLYNEVRMFKSNPVSRGHSDCSKWLFSDCEWTELLPCGTE